MGRNQEAKADAKAKASRARQLTTPAKEIAGFIARFDPPVARMIRAARAALRKRLPTAVEQVYDNYNFLAIGYCSTERTSDCIMSLAASAHGVALSFYYGASLPDPHGILLGGGKQNRFVRLESAAALRQPAVEALIQAAVATARTRLPPRGRGYSMVKSVSARQRPRQKAAGSAAMRAGSRVNRE